MLGIGKRAWLARAVALLLALLLSVACPRFAAGYAVLAHEAIIDTAWDTNIRPMLLQRFPNATPEELKEAHGYAYGGAIIQDLGYYPHGSHFFSDLTHYVRSGDLSAICFVKVRMPTSTPLPWAHCRTMLRISAVIPQ